MKNKKGKKKEESDDELNQSEEKSVKSQSNASKEDENKSEEENSDNQKEKSETPAKVVPNKKTEADKVSSPIPVSQNVEEDDNETEPAELAVIEGPLTVLSDKGGGEFGDSRNYYAKYFFKGQFLVFFNKQDVDTLCVFYIKTKNLGTIEDFYNTNPTQVYIEYNEGKKDKRFVLVIPDIKTKDKWVDSLGQFKDHFLDFSDRQDADFGKSEAEMKYLLTENFESKLKRNFITAKIKTIRL